MLIFQITENFCIYHVITAMCFSWLHIGKFTYKFSYKKESNNRSLLFVLDICLLSVFMDLILRKSSTKIKKGIFARNLINIPEWSFLEEINILPLRFGVLFRAHI